MMLRSQLRNVDPPGLSPQKLIILLWGTVGLANAIISRVGPDRWSETLRVLAASGCGLLLSLGLSVATQHVIERHSRYRWLSLGLFVLSGGTTLWAIDTTLQMQTISLATLHWPKRQDFLELRFNVVYYNLLFTLQTAAQALLSSNRALRVREHQLAESRRTAQQAQLAALRYQLNPHFLFNSLNAVSALAGEAGAKEAEEMLDRIADYFRATLASEPQDFTTLESELETVQAYLDIEFVRFGERMRIQYDCDAELGDALVPRLILQPLVENAVKYAVAPSTELVEILVRAAQVGDDILLEIKDEKKTASSSMGTPGVGVGLTNVAERLKVLYKDDAELHVSRSDQGFVATVRMPLKRSAPGKRQ